ncbi:UDP binding domain-containing protein, partial [Pseudomonas aeruginosa]|uniref:UDP binding domain-containing protein n=1 Tax=Pseudomonas aeruginosa TaxID=287 RepID=UPI00396822BF
SAEIMIAFLAVLKSGGADLITSHDTRKVGLLGLSFKAGTDDLRESPLVELAEMLIGKGYELRIFDRNVEYARVHGANKEYIESKIPHVSSLLVSDLDEVVASSDVLVLGNGDELFVDLVNKTPSGKKLVDLVGFMPHTTTAQAEGICW